MDGHKFGKMLKNWLKFKSLYREHYLIHFFEQVQFYIPAMDSPPRWFTPTCLITGSIATICAGVVNPSWYWRSWSINYPTTNYTSTLMDFILVLELPLHKHTPQHPCVTKTDKHTPLHEVISPPMQCDGAITWNIHYLHTNAVAMMIPWNAIVTLDTAVICQMPEFKEEEKRWDFGVYDTPILHELESLLCLSLKQTVYHPPPSTWKLQEFIVIFAITGVDWQNTSLCQGR